MNHFITLTYIALDSTLAFAVVYNRLTRDWVPPQAPANDHTGRHFRYKFKFYVLHTDVDKCDAGKVLSVWVFLQYIRLDCILLNLQTSSLFSANLLAVLQAAKGAAPSQKPTAADKRDVIQAAIDKVVSLLLKDYVDYW